MKNNQNNDLNDRKLVNKGCTTVNRNPTSDNELAIKKYIDDELDKNIVPMFNQTLETYLKVSDRNDINNLKNYDEKQKTDTTNTKNPNQGGYILQQWNIKCNDRNGNGKLNNLRKINKTSNPTRHSGATSSPPIAEIFLYIGKSSDNQDNNVFVSWERTDKIQNSNITFYFNSFSILTNDNLKNMGRFRIQFLLEENTRSTRYNIHQKDRYNDSSTDWTCVKKILTVENYGRKLLNDQIDTPHANMCVSKITITQSVY